MRSARTRIDRTVAAASRKTSDGPTTCRHHWRRPSASRSSARPARPAAIGPPRARGPIRNSWVAPICGSESSLSLLSFVLIGALDQPLHGLHGQRRAVAQVEMNVEKDRPEGEEFGENDRVRRWRILGRAQQRGAYPFADRLFARERLNPRVLLGRDLRADRLCPSRCHATTPYGVARETAHRRTWLSAV